MNRKIKKSVSLLFVLSLFQVFGSISRADTIEISNISGSDRFSTSTSISKNGWRDGSKNVILVNSQAVADSLSVAPLASKMKSPVLLTDSESLNIDSREEITRLGAKNITIVGGEASISAGIEEDLKREGYSVERISGSSRSETSINIAEKLKSLGLTSTSAFLVNGTTGLADAAGIGSVAAKNSSPIIFSTGSDSDVIGAKLGELSISKLYLVGGTRSLSSNFEGLSSDVERISGSDRNETNLSIIEKFYPNYSTIYIADDGSENQSKLIDSVLINAGIIASIGGDSSLDIGPVMLVSQKNGLTINQIKSIYNNPVKSIVQVSGGSGISTLINNISKFINHKGEEKYDSVFEKLINYENMRVEYKTNYGVRILGANEIISMIDIDFSDGNIKFDKKKVEDFIEKFDQKGYETSDSDSFAYWEKNNVKIVKGSYENKLDKNYEVDRLMKILSEGKSVVGLLPKYIKTSTVPKNAKNIGKKYVEISLSKQHMIVWDNGKKVVSTPVVTGNPNRGMATPPGIFTIKNKMRNVVLRGPGYASPVKYWIPFNGSIGIHDSSWQSAYGGKRYLYAGSHGCINTPLKDVSALYNNVKVGTPVIVLK